MSKFEKFTRDEMKYIKDRLDKTFDNAIDFIEKNQKDGVMFNGYWNCRKCVCSHTFRASASRCCDHEK